jgi:hypothetical protein
VLEEIVEMVKDPSLFTDQEIVAMGDQRRVDGEVINPANGFAFGFTAAEHFLCKGWIMIKKMFHHYRKS